MFVLPHNCNFTLCLTERGSVSVRLYPLARPNLGTHTKLIQDPHLLGYYMLGKWFLMI